MKKKLQKKPQTMKEAVAVGEKLFKEHTHKFFISMKTYALAYRQMFKKIK